MGDEPKIKAFTARAREINMALEKAMEAYTKMFDDIYALLYPADDPSKSKKEREKRKKNGSYFTEEESEAVMQLFTTGKFLLQLVDTKFEGENGGK
jgi:hypothetical protein